MREKLEALATLIADFREGEIPQPDADHVGRWVAQFDAEDREPLLDELHHVWSQLYFSEPRARAFLRMIISNEKFVGAAPQVIPIDVGMAYQVRQEFGAARSDDVDDTRRNVGPTMLGMP